MNAVEMFCFCFVLGIGEGRKVKKKISCRMAIALTQFLTFGIIYIVLVIWSAEHYILSQKYIPFMVFY